MNPLMKNYILSNIVGQIQNVHLFSFDNFLQHILVAASSGPKCVIVIKCPVSQYIIDSWDMVYFQTLQFQRFYVVTNQR